MSTGAIAPESRVLLHHATWQQYVQLRDADDNRNTRMTFDRGSLEFMSPTGLHESLKMLIGQCVAIWILERRIPIKSCGSTTFRREDMKRGLEPDNCYYVQNESRVRGQNEIDLTIDPPPDLVIEIDVTSSSINRFSIYAAFGVPEIWRWHKDELNLFSLESGRYVKTTASRALPGFPFERLMDIVGRRSSVDEMTLMSEFRAWCQQSGANRG